MSKNDSEPAFPVPGSEYGGTGTFFGMTLRDYFAAKAMQAVISEGCYDYEEGASPDAQKRANFAARDAYRFADAMLTARGEQ